MTVTPDPPVDLDKITDDAEDERLQNALLAFTHAVCGTLEHVCSYGLTIGESYVPFDPDDEDDCEDEEVHCTQAWVRVAGVTASGGIDSFGGACAVVLRMDLEVGILRCIEVEEGGEAPKAGDVLVAAMQSMRDMNSIYREAIGLEVWDAIYPGQWVPNGPAGGQYGGIWMFTVEL